MNDPALLIFPLQPLPPLPLHNSPLFIYHSPSSYPSPRRQFPLHLSSSLAKMCLWEADMFYCLNMSTFTYSNKRTYSRRISSSSASRRDICADPSDYRCHRLAEYPQHPTLTSSTIRRRKKSIKMGSIAKQSSHKQNIEEKWENKNNPV